MLCCYVSGSLYQSIVVPFIFMVGIDPWRCRHDIPSKRWELLTHWHSITIQQLSSLQDKTGWSVKQKKKMLPGKIHVDSYSFDIAESEYDNQIALSPTSVKWERIKF